MRRLNLWLCSFFLLLLLVSCGGSGPMSSSFFEMTTNILQAAAANFDNPYVKTLAQFMQATTNSANLGISTLEETTVEESSTSTEESEETTVEESSTSTEESEETTVEESSTSAVKADTRPLLVLEAGIYKQVVLADGSTSVAEIEDGAVLRDGRDDPQAGDKLKIFFQANCACYVYVVAIDGSGFAEPVFPNVRDGFTNPVVEDQQYIIPEESSTWYGLDKYRGIEHIYFVASYSPRPELEQIISDLSAKKRPTRGQAYRPVQEPTVILSRGIKRIQTSTSIPAGAMKTGPSTSATMFQAAAGEADLVITRWFRHE